MITLQMVYFNYMNEHGKVVERKQQPMNEEFKSKKELEAFRRKLEDAANVNGNEVVIRLQYLTQEDR